MLQEGSIQTIKYVWPESTEPSRRVIVIASEQMGQSHNAVWKGVPAAPGMGESF